MKSFITVYRNVIKNCKYCDGTSENLVIYKMRLSKKGWIFFIDFILESKWIFKKRHERNVQKRIQKIELKHMMEKEYNI